MVPGPHLGLSGALPASDHGWRLGARADLGGGLVCVAPHNGRVRNLEENPMNVLLINAHHEYPGWSTGKLNHSAQEVA